MRIKKSLYGFIVGAQRHGVVGLPLVCLCIAFIAPAFAAAQQRAAMAGVNPFDEIARAESVPIAFTGTALAGGAKAKADVALRGDVLLVRVRARDVPAPTQLGVPRYALWVYVPNHRMKLYIGDLPVAIKRDGASGTSDTAYRYTALPPNSIFGGLILTAEPVRYTAIVEEALRPVFVGLLPEVDINEAVAAPTFYIAPPRLPDR